jgi:bifunctional DNA-binding transcriptional regulator/antitoxin component of YhaV-PrlF toxin-antitoxin module
MVHTKETVLVGIKRELTVPEEISQAVGLEPGDRVQFRATGPRTLELTVLPPLTLEEWWEYYPVDEPLDMEKLQEEVEEAMAADAISELERD